MICAAAGCPSSCCVSVAAAALRLGTSRSPMSCPTSARGHLLTFSAAARRVPSAGRKQCRRARQRGDTGRVVRVLLYEHAFSSSPVKRNMELSAAGMGAQMGGKAALSLQRLLRWAGWWGGSRCLCEGSACIAFDLGVCLLLSWFICRPGVHEGNGKPTQTLTFIRNYKMSYSGVQLKTKPSLLSCACDK